jgi:hypothetical protein
MNRKTNIGDLKNQGVLLLQKFRPIHAPARIFGEIKKILSLSKKVLTR